MTTYAKPTNLFLMLFLVQLFLISCSNNISKKSINQKQSKDEIMSQIRAEWDDFTNYWEQKDIDKLVMMYTEDGVNIPASFKENNGREEIENYYKLLFSSNKEAEYEHSIISLDIHEGLVIEQGEFVANWTRNDNTNWSNSGRSITHWKKNKDGKWQIKLFLFNKPAQTVMTE